MKFCSACGAAVERRVPQGEDRERWVCPACGTVHYENPRMVVGCIVEEGDRILLCKRAIEPRYGYWTVPAGFLELGESTVQGAVRETWEEAGAKVEAIAPYAHFDITHIGQAYIFYRAKLKSPEMAPGTESLELKLVTVDEIPWSELAFPSVRVALELYREDVRNGFFRVHHGIVTRDAEGKNRLFEHMAVKHS
ncbi:MAG TPA: NUDIX hydrolase [Polyangiales bacterium]|jgi:ADP-ribose/FAD diphosphatase|nr:NUDIX hydrolase [Polyangiales bacterium]